MALVLAALWFEGREEEGVAPGAYGGRVTHVVDGDTLDVRDEQGVVRRIRLLGVDCLETHHEEKLGEQARQWGISREEARRLGEEATARMRELVHRREVVWIVPEGGRSRDRYGRVLAYVEVEGRDVGELLLKEGLAEARRERHARSRDYERAARAGGMR